MPVEFARNTCTDYSGYVFCDSTKLIMAYDGAGRRISKTRMKKTAFDGPWYASLVTHYTGIGTEIRENPVSNEAKVVMNMPNGLGRYEPEDAAVPPSSSTSRTFEWYLKNHLGSTMLVYASGYGTPGVVRAAYDYRAFGEQVTLTESADKVTENFTGKEKDDETELNYFGARYLDPMLGMWTSVDPARQFASPYLYAGNGMNPINGVDEDGNVFGAENQEVVDLINEKSYNQYRLENGLVQECLVCRNNPNGSLNYSNRISSAIMSDNFGEIINSGLSSREEFYAKANGGTVTSIERGHPTAVVINGSAQDALHELSSHVFPAMLGNRPGNGSAIKEELMNSPDYLYFSPLDIPDHPIDQIHYETVE